MVKLAVQVRGRDYDCEDSAGMPAVAELLWPGAPPHLVRVGEAGTFDETVMAPPDAGVASVAFWAFVRMRNRRSVLPVPAEPAGQAAGGA
ncbi:hypothetical protein GCM10022419_127830 [Nonomuraea rosea]|uniref:Uncharacterized protein n=1 Tax=Nonomuraea rosea TaxID=638574 RepID=A0ABP6ZZC4_9ACTN